MPLNPVTLGPEIVTKIKEVKALTPAQEADAIDTWTKVAEAIIAHFIANGVISTTVAPGILLTTPDTINGATTGPGTGTGTMS